VHSREQPTPGLRRLAYVQDGVLTREQALGLGLGRHALSRLLGEQQWQVLAPGVYLTTNGVASWRALAWAGVLIGGDDARLGGTAAGYLHGLTSIEPRPLLVLIPHRSRLRSRDHWSFQRERPGSRSSRATGNPPRLLVEDTVLDLCATGGADDAVTWLTAAVRDRLTTPARLVRALRGRARHPHRELLLGLLADVDTGVESYLELLYLRDVERSHGLPQGERQLRSVDGRIRSDVIYREQRVVVELDGLLFHDGMDRFRDMWRDNVATLDDWLTLRYGAWHLTHQPCEVGDQVADFLVRRGWTGLPTRCPRCRLVS
jgi:hypothetical protein